MDVVLSLTHSPLSAEASRGREVKVDEREKAPRKHDTSRERDREDGGREPKRAKEEPAPRVKEHTPPVRQVRAHVSIV